MVDNRRDGYFLCTRRVTKLRFTVKAMDQRMRQRAVAPRYTFPEAAILLDRPAATLRRWSVGNRRGPKAGGVEDRPLIDYASVETGEQRPLLTVKFRAIGGELFKRYADSPAGQDLLVNASRGGQAVLPELVAMVTRDIDYEDEVAHRWYPRGHDSLVYIDTKVAGGRPITAITGTRADAIASRLRQGMGVEEIAWDTGAEAAEITAVGELEHVAPAA
jgi:uncharacterized protein (DUF433 family)